MTRAATASPTPAAKPRARTTAKPRVRTANPRARTAAKPRARGAAPGATRSRPTRAATASPTPAALEAAILALLDERGTASACPSEVARRVGGRDWRPLMQPVRDAAARLQREAQIDVYQRGRPVQLAAARGPIRLRARAVTEIDYRAAPERYVIGRGEQGVLTVEPYKSELLPHWRFRTPALATTSARALYRAFLAYGRAGDFVGMDMARKFLQMGWTRARRYANHRSGRKYAGRVVRPRDAGPDKAAAAEIFRAALDRARRNRTYAKLRQAHIQRAAP